MCCPEVDIEVAFSSAKPLGRLCLDGFLFADLNGQAMDLDSPDSSNPAGLGEPGGRGSLWDAVVALCSPPPPPGGPEEGQDDHFSPKIAGFGALGG